MSDEQKPDKPNDGWVMPEPVYRSSPGHVPKSIHLTDDAEDITTQPGFTDQDNVDTLVPDFVDAGETPTVDSIKVASAPPAPKKGGCASSILTVFGVIALAVIGIVIALIYFLFYYKSADTSTF